MSCQQLIQEDPYVFTDTVSNSTNFMQENNSQAKYVPLNRQTIYNRQFRQHEPSIASTDSIIRIQKSAKNFDKKIIISPASLKERKNGYANNGSILTTTSSSSSSSSPRTSPKFFKSHQQQQIVSQNDNDGQLLVNSNSTVINHSIASQSVSNQQQHQQLQQKNIFQLNHVAKSLDENCITGIKHEVSNDDDSIVYNDAKSDDKCNRIRKGKKTNKLSWKRSKLNARVRSQNIIVEPISDLPRIAPQVQLLDSYVINKRLLHCNNDENKQLSRDERLNMRKIHLQHVLDQHDGMYQLHRISLKRSKLHFNKTHKILKAMERAKGEILKKSVKTCYTRDCQNEAIALSDYCVKHIFTAEKEQFLIRQCCFLQHDGQQCRVPVYDFMASVAVCNDHMNAPAHQLISDSTKPKPQVQRKRTKTSPLIRPVKKNGKAGRKKKIITAAQSNMMIPAHRPTMVIHPSDIQKNPVNKNVSTTNIQMKQENNTIHNHHESNQFIHHNSGNLLASSQSSYGSLSGSGNEDLYLKQDLMKGICENNYESSEDTGVSGLSENELISHDVIGNFDIESCAELSKVLSSLPSNTLDDLLTEPLHTSNDEEYLDRAIEEVSATGMDQIAITAFENFDGLEMFEMDDEEQRQMISAATNLISMSSYLSSHDDNNYSAMPSPMMS